MGRHRRQDGAETLCANRTVAQELERLHRRCKRPVSPTEDSIQACKCPSDGALGAVGEVNQFKQFITDVNVFD